MLSITITRLSDGVTSVTVDDQGLAEQLVGLLRVLSDKLRFAAQQEDRSWQGA